MGYVSVVHVADFFAARYRITYYRQVDAGRRPDYSAVANYKYPAGMPARTPKGFVQIIRHAEIIGDDSLAVNGNRLQFQQGG